MEMVMTIGSTANIAFAFETIRKTGRPFLLGPEHRLALILLSDRFGMGASMIDIGEMHRLLGTEDPSHVKGILARLAVAGVIRLTQFVDDTVFAGSSIATEAEIADVRRHLRCDWPFHNWAGET
ncbi:hypothetical protein NKH17_12500 [Mesorhizobium sp. M1334]|uniref:hypothetical protein n=1 Tax=Mesorhizobium sp. M1334 TaxID=2957084 RepID=UPI003338D8A2